MTSDLVRSTTDGAALAAAREGFLRVETPDLSGVREAILASWWRSRDADVAADRLELQYVRDPNLDTPLTRSAEPVLRHLREQLDGQSVSIVLTDPAGVVLSRLTADAALERHLDRVVPVVDDAHHEAGLGAVVGQGDRVADLDVADRDARAVARVVDLGGALGADEVAARDQGHDGQGLGEGILHASNVGRAR